MRARAIAGCLMGVAVLGAACARTDDGPAYVPVVPAEAGGDASVDRSDAATAPEGGGPGSPDGSTPDAADSGAGGDAADAADARDAAIADTGPPDAGCPTGSMALVVGTTTRAAGLSWTNGAWSAPTNLAGSLAARPAVAPTASGFAVAVRQDGDTLATATLGSAWSTLATSAGPDGGATFPVVDEPRLSAGGGLDLVVQQKTTLLYQHATWTGPSPGVPSPIGAAGDSSFGPRSPSVASVGGALLIAHAGGNKGVYARARTGGAFAASTEVLPANSSDNDRTTALVELTSGVALLVYSQLATATTPLFYATRTGATWTGGGKVAGDSTFSGHPLAMVALASSRAALVFRGDDTNLYVSTYDPAATPKWTAAVSLVGQVITTASAPAIAPGTCGADAVVAYVEGANLTTSGTVKVTRLAQGAWSAPETVPGAGGATWVGLATKP